MKKIVTIQKFASFSEMNFYTFMVEGDDTNETNKFFDKYADDPHVEEDLNIIATWIKVIGNKQGDKSRYFRFENAAQALPPPKKFMIELGDNFCRLRLYCVYLSDQIVILSNGGVKQSRDAQSSPELQYHFQFANKMAVQLLKLLQRREVITLDKEIINLHEIELEI